MKKIEEILNANFFLKQNDYLNIYYKLIKKNFYTSNIEEGELNL